MAQETSLQHTKNIKETNIKDEMHEKRIEAKEDQQKEARLLDLARRRQIVDSVMRAKSIIVLDSDD